MPRFRAVAAYADELGREREETIQVSALTGDPDELSRRAEEEWERMHPEQAGLLPEDLAWEQVSVEEEE